MKKMIRVLIADDSKTFVELLSSILASAADIKIIAIANDGKDAIELVNQLKPDFIIMDIMMPRMDGISAIKKIMEQCPTPILVISSFLNNNTMNLQFDAMQAGALSVIAKPKGILDPEFEKIKKQILNYVHILSEIHVFRKYTSTATKIKFPVVSNQVDFKLLALGTSTGGPVAIKTILAALPATFPIPIIIVQHISKGFLTGLIHWLQDFTPLKIMIADDSQSLLPGFVYFAPDHYHLKLKKGADPVTVLENSAPIKGIKPSINVLFSSIAINYPKQSIGGLLTGMGNDGVEGLLEMKSANCFTFVQSVDSCIVDGMPQAALACDATQNSIPLLQIPEFLAKLITKKG